MADAQSVAPKGQAQAASLSPLRKPRSPDAMSLGDTLQQLPRMIRALGVVKDCHTAARCVRVRALDALCISHLRVAADQPTHVGHPRAPESGKWLVVRREQSIPAAHASWHPLRLE